MADEVIEVTNTPEQTKKPKKKHYWWRYLLFFLGGFLFAFVSVAGAGAIVGTVMKTQDVVSMFGGNPDEVLGEDYKNTTILNMVITLSNKKFDSLEDINDVTPLVKKFYDENVAKAIKDNLHFELSWEKISQASFSSNGEDSIGKVLESELYDGIKIVDFIKDSNSLSKIYKYFLYDVVRDTNGEVIKDTNGNVTIDENAPLTLGQYAKGASFLNNIMDYIRVGDVVEGADTSTDPIIIALRDTSVKGLKDRVQTLTVGELFTDAQKASNPLIADDCLGGKTLSQLGDAETINGIKINKLLTNRDSLSNLMKVVYDLDLTVEELKTTDLTTKITIGDIFPDSDNKIINALKTKKISDLSNPDTIKELKLCDILDIPEEDDGSLLWKYRTYSIADLETIDEDGGIDLDTIKVFSFFSDEEIEANPVLKALHDRYPELTVKGLSDYEVISTLPLGSFLGDVSGNVILTKLIEKGATISNLPEVVNSLTVADVIELTPEDETNHTIKYNIVTALGSTQITKIADNFDTLKLGQVLYITESSPLVLKSLQNTTLGGLANAFDTLKIKDVIDIPAGSALDKEAIKNASISSGDDLFNVIKNNLTLEDVIAVDENSPKLIQTLKATHLSELGDVINGLKLKDVITLDEDSHPILVALQNAELFSSGANSINNKMTNLKFNEVFRESECQEGFMKLLWDDTDGGDFAISQMATKTSDIVKSKTLYQLFDAGLLEGVENRSKLDKDFGSGKKVGEMTIAEFINIAVNLPTF